MWYNPTVYLHVDDPSVLSCTIVHHGTKWYNPTMYHTWSSVPSCTHIPWYIIVQSHTTTHGLADPSVLSCTHIPWYIMGLCGTIPLYTTHGLANPPAPKGSTGCKNIRTGPPDLSCTLVPMYNLAVLFMK